MASSVDSRPPLLQTSCAKIVEATVRKSASNLKRDECSCVESRLSFERKKQLRQWLGEKIVEYENSLGKVGGEGTFTLINEQEYSTVIKRIYCPSDEQYKTLKAFHGHLVANFFSTIKVSSFKGNKFSSLVIYPAPALVHFYYAVSPAFLVVQDLTQCGESKATMVMKALEVTMENFHCGFDVLASRLISKTQRVLQEVPTSEKTFLWETRMSLMIHDNDAILTSINKVEDCTLYQALLAYRLPVQRASSSPRIEPKAKLSPTKANQVQEMQFEILHLRETVRSLEDKLDESESKLREKDSTSTKNTETQTSNKDEEKIQIKALNERVLSLKDELKKSQQKCSEVEGSFKKMEAYHKQELVRLTKKNKDVENKANALEEKLESMKEYLNEILNDYGCALVERDKLARETTSDKTANPRTTNLCSTSCQTCQMPSLQATNLTHSEETRGAEAITNNVEQASLTNVTSERAAERNLSVTTIQQSREETNEQEKISLSNIPATVVERSLYNNYKMLLLTIARLLLSGEVAQFKAWVFSKFSVDAMSLNVDEIFLELDRKEVISAFDLRKLREFFEGILKIEVVHMIDSFLVGDYLPLRSASHCDVSKKNILTSNGNPSAVASHIGTFGSGNGCRGTSQSTVADFRPSSFVGKPGCFEVEESCVVRRDSSRETPLLPGNHRSKKATEEKATTRQAVQTFLVTNGSSRGSEGQVSNPAAALTRPRSQVDFGSNGKKLSKFQRPDSPGRRSTSARGSADDHNDDDLDDDSQWLCNHYKRRCYVKFGCCNKYWPCHRCHNNESKCGETKLKSRDTKFVKCVKCGTKQPFGANSQYCSNCHLKFAKYFCEICKHLTGTDDNPYHCEKCGICRIHGDRSFHCDVCGVCLDVQLRGNHKCRAGSAHDECCICLEDAFTGCQILPCSHKVHKECATQMIRSGITRCPICRESFAHKLERRNLPPSRKNK